MYPLFAPQIPQEKLSFFENPKSLGLLAAGLGILANNRGNYGAFAPALGAGGLLGLQTLMGQQQLNTRNLRDNRRDAQNAGFENQKIGLLNQESKRRERELGFQEQDRTAETMAGGLVGNILSDYSGGSGSGGGEGGIVAAPIPHFTGPQAVKTPYSENTAAQGPVNIPHPEQVVEGEPPWKVVDAKLLELDALVKQDPAIAKTKVYQQTYERLSKTREFLSKQGEVKSVPGAEGVFYQEGMSKPYEWVDDGKGDLKKRFISTQEINERGLKKAAAGASKIDIKTGESVAKEIGPMLKESRDEAVGAIEQVDSAQRIKKAINDGKIIAGPTATIRLKGAQIASMLGVGGTTTEEAIANTRQAIRGLAEFTISARKKLKGQGQVTEYEQKTLQKAYSGEIDDLTVQEIKTVADLTERLGRLQYKNHQQQLKNMEKDDSTKKLVPFFSVPDILPEMESGDGWSIRPK